MNNLMIISSCITHFSLSPIEKTPHQKLILSANFHGILTHIIPQEKMITFPRKYQINYQLSSSWCLLKGKSESATPEIYYLFKDNNEDIQVKVMFNIDNKQPVMPKDFIVIKNKFMKQWIYFIKKLKEK
ncbi:hypothetical protein [Xenorhabdus lircayensis]|uniref:Uncharacterized protein n=1 Tax=Xenorhabdus lircayensis TaxID=2763499 RepID=A0ABS0U0S3_9GAMM|nr:hypothetical protein [Xenorhabdus lircayensis]MBI6547467.1 hypothetical protein [Xenorhabdus lircayensis]